VTKVSKQSAKQSKKKTASKAKQVNRKAKPKRARKRLPFSEALARRLGFEHDDLTAADIALHAERPLLRKTLAEYCLKYPPVRAGWGRGQFLRNLKGLAGVVETVSEAARKLGFDSGLVLRDIIDSDPEAADIWNQTRLDTRIKARAALVKAAEDGNQAAIRVVEGYLHEDSRAAGPRTDLTKLMQTEMAELFGVTRQTVTEWTNSHHAPRNSDRSYDLKDMITWYRQFVKTLASPKSAPADTLRDLKAESMKISLAERKSELLERDIVICGIIARWQNIVASFKYKNRELAAMVHGQTIDNIEDILGRAFEDLQGEWLEVPEFLQLGTGAKEKMSGLLKMIKENGDDNGDRK